jgi:hypothetical protein
VVPVGSTTSETVLLTLPLLLLSPESVATMESVPVAANEVVQAALPETSVTAAQPLIVVPFEVNPMVPVGEVPPTVAVKVTDSLVTTGFALATSVVVVLPLFTTWPPESVPVLVVKFVSPEYTAVTTCVPAVSVAVLPELAVPALNVTGEPKLLPSIVNCTVPVGVPAPGAAADTVAVKLTDCPYADGFRLDTTAALLPA